MYAAMTMKSTNYNTAQLFLNTIASFDGQGNVALRTTDCRHTLLPSRLGFPPHISNDAWAENFRYLSSVLSKLDIKSSHVLESADSRQISLWARAETSLKVELRDEEWENNTDDLWDFNNEFVFVLQFDEDGKISEIWEMLDSKLASGVMPLMERASARMTTRTEI